MELQNLSETSELNSDSESFKFRGKNVQTSNQSVKKSKKQKKSVTFLYDWICSRGKYFFEHAKKEKVLLKYNWRVILIGILFQYVHSVATNVAYFLHVRRQPLYDLGFAFLPALSPKMQIVSEIMFFSLFICTGFFVLSPFFFRQMKDRYSVIMLSRFLGVCIISQSLRSLSFLVTVLPGPNYHCRPGSSQYNPPNTPKEIFFRTDAFLGCGDLVFSSHTIFVLLCALTFNKYSEWKFLKKIVWILVFIFGLLVVAARKHYSLDILVAWYTVPLLWIAYEKYFPDRIPSEINEEEDFEDIEKGVFPPV